MIDIYSVFYQIILLQGFLQKYQIFLIVYMKPRNSKMNYTNYPIYNFPEFIITQIDCIIIPHLNMILN